MFGQSLIRKFIDLVVREMLSVSIDAALAIAIQSSIISSEITLILSFRRVRADKLQDVVLSFLVVFRERWAPRAPWSHEKDPQQNDSHRDEIENVNWGCNNQASKVKPVDLQEEPQTCGRKSYCRNDDHGFGQTLYHLLNHFITSERTLSIMVRRAIAGTMNAAVGPISEVVSPKSNASGRLRGKYFEIV